MSAKAPSSHTLPRATATPAPESWLEEDRASLVGQGLARRGSGIREERVLRVDGRIVGVRLLLGSEETA